jgi:hypothetical protein
MVAKMKGPEKREPLPDIGRQAFLDADDRKPVRVEVPSLGGAVYIRVMSGNERAAWETLASKLGAEENKNAVVLASLVAMTASDKMGNLLFCEEDIPALAEKAATSILPIALKAKRVNALGDEDIEALAKN